MELRDYVEQLANIKARKKEIADEEKDLNKEKEEVEAEIAMLMLNSGLDKVSYPGIGSASPSLNHFPKITDEQAFFDYLEETGQGGMVKRVVPHQTLRAWFKDQVFDRPVKEIGLLDFTKTTINFRRK